MQLSSLFSKIAIIGLFLWLTSCASGLKSFQRGDYYRACEEAVSRLRNKPDHEDARIALVNAYPLAVENAKCDINNIIDLKDFRNYEQIIAIYDQMNYLANEIRHCPAALKLVPQPAEYYKERQQAVQAVTQMLYDQGEKALNYGSLEQARVALDYFQRANRYTPGYKDVRNKIEQARYEATLRVVVTRPMLPRNYSLSADFFYDKLMNEITRNTYRHLVRFYTPEEASADRMNNPHQILELHFEDFTVGNTRETSNTVELTRDSVLVGSTTNRNGTKQDVYGTVKAKLTTFRVEIISAGVLGMRIIDGNNGRVLNHKDFAGRYVWASEWASFNGDERALNKAQKALVEKRRMSPPPPQDLFAGFANPLYAQATEYISSIY